MREIRGIGEAHPRLRKASCCPCNLYLLCHSWPIRVDMFCGRANCISANQMCWRVSWTLCQFTALRLDQFII
jgi:hypothetical protein